MAPLRLRRGAVDEFARRYRYRWRPGRPRRRARRGSTRSSRSARCRRARTPASRARPPLPVFHGSDWFTLSRRAVDAVLDAPGAVVDHFLHTIVPTEAFVHTVLANSALRLANDHRRYAVFEPPRRPSPRVFGLADVDAVLASGADFARKFADSAVLDEIDRRSTPTGWTLDAASYGAPPNLCAAMTPPASILFPTRDRREYLAVALASVAPQAAAHGAEIVVVEDDAARRRRPRRWPSATARATSRSGAPRGINVARNAAVAASSGELAVLPRRRRRGLARLARRAARGAARSTRRSAGRSGRGWRARGCARAGASRCRSPRSISAREDRDAEFVWGANMALRRERVRADRAVRRAARRRRRRGGLAAPAARRRRARRLRRRRGRRPPPHRRDARLRSLSRPTFYRGRAARRYDVFKGTAPRSPPSCGRSAGCVWHVLRRRCGVGITLTALTLGRLAETLDPAPGAAERDRPRLPLRPLRDARPPRRAARRRARPARPR